MLTNCKNSTMVHSERLKLLGYGPCEIVTKVAASYPSGSTLFVLIKTSKTILIDWNISLRGPVTDQGRGIDHFQAISSLFSWNIWSKSFVCLDFSYTVLLHKSKQNHISIVFLSCIFLALEVDVVGGLTCHENSIDSLRWKDLHLLILV